MSLSCRIESSKGLLGVKLVVDEALDFLCKNNIGINEFAFRLVLTEALNNAVIHGNQQRQELKVVCMLEVEDQTLTLIIENDGPGFDWQKAIKVSNENRLKDAFTEGGRGFVIYKLYGYDFSFNDDGRQVKLMRTLDC